MPVNRLKRALQAGLPPSLSDIPPSEIKIYVFSLPPGQNRHFQIGINGPFTTESGNDLAEHVRAIYRTMPKGTSFTVRIYSHLNLNHVLLHYFEISAEGVETTPPPTHAP